MNFRSLSLRGHRVLYFETAAAQAPPPQREVVARTVDGEEIERFVEECAGTDGASDHLGCHLNPMSTPDRAGKLSMGLSALTIRNNISDRIRFRGIAGRYANRIAKGKFTLEGKLHIGGNNGRTICTAASRIR